MRLKSIYLSEYKNLKDFTLKFDGISFIDVFVGKNGSGKSNLFEALIEIFQHLYEFDKNSPTFNYTIKYEINNKDTEVAWKNETQILSIDGTERKSIINTPLPDNVLIYYSGHNNKVTDIVTQYLDDFKNEIKGAKITDTRKFIGIGKEYKQLLLAVLLMQKEDNKARQFICHKLGITAIAPELNWY